MVYKQRNGMVQVEVSSTEPRGDHEVPAAEQPELRSHFQRSQRGAEM